MTNNNIMDDWNTIKLHIETLAIENQNLKADFATVLDLLTGVKKMIEAQATLNEVAIEHSEIYQWILKIIELSKPGSIIVKEIEDLRQQENDIKDHVDQILIKMDLEKYMDQGIVFALQNILERIEP